MRVREVMTVDVISVAPDRPLREVARLLVSRKVSGIPVVEKDGWVLGFVSEADFLAHDARSPTGGGAIARLLGRRPSPKATARTTGEATTSPAVTIGPDASVRDGVVRLAGTIGRRTLDPDHGTYLEAAGPEP
jgi:CBS domain-containing protein